MTNAIEVQGISKLYHLSGRQGDRYTALRDVVAQKARNFAQRTLGMGKPPGREADGEDFWALSDISFDIRAGDRVGIIGRNGAGKSTLLKVLSRITEPTSGRFSIRGRVASLLEVGTGFHPELTGRENIHLNGAIMGMSRREVRAKFDEIVAFAEVERFLDTPVKRYSSGMYVRLAFAVAAHLEPEILIVDEVLAVGDAQFQRKCLGKMESVGSDGRTVLFVSHNMAMISNLCQSAILLDGGRLKAQGAVSAVVEQYYRASLGEGLGASRRVGSDLVELLDARVVGVDGQLGATIHDDISIRIRYEILGEVDGRCVPNLHFFAADGSYVFVTNAEVTDRSTPGLFTAHCTVPGSLLNEGAYFVGIALTTHFESGGFNVEFFERSALTFNVIDPMDSRSIRYGYGGPIPGVIRPKLAWQVARD